MLTILDKGSSLSLKFSSKIGALSDEIDSFIKTVSLSDFFKSNSSFSGLYFVSVFLSKSKLSTQL